MYRYHALLQAFNLNFCPIISTGSSLIHAHAHINGVTTKGSTWPKPGALGKELLREILANTKLKKYKFCIQV